MDEPAEVDDGYVTLVNARENEQGVLTENPERTGLWAWSAISGRFISSSRAPPSKVRKNVRKPVLGL